MTRLRRPAWTRWAPGVGTGEWARADEGLHMLLLRWEMPERRALERVLVPPSGVPDDAAQLEALRQRHSLLWAAICGLREQLCTSVQDDPDSSAATAALGVLLVPTDARAKRVAEGDSLTP